MQPGNTLSGLTLDITDETGNRITLENASILCRERHSTKKDPNKIKRLGYRFEVFTHECLGRGDFGQIHPISATLKLNEQGRIEIIKSAKQRVLKILFNPTRFEPDETDIGVNIPYLHMKPSIKKRRYIVMRKIPGKTLDKLLYSPDIENLPEKTKLLLLIGLLETLQNLHKQNIFHNDLKLDNIIVNFEAGLLPKLYIIDFGAAIQLGHKDYQASAADINDIIKIFHETARALKIDNLELNQLMDNMIACLSPHLVLQNTIDKLRAIYSSLLESNKVTIITIEETNKPEKTENKLTMDPNNLSGIVYSSVQFFKKMISYSLENSCSSETNSHNKNYLGGLV
ncbi:serine/threonine protein kinase [Candidatus Rickettsiella viridis]|uniref:Serine/threonine protein kinase n=2 Tax=Candidatus Rickettsiella viridis TaxID=676208 RepID=A0A2Z5UVT7_9COXI|nr:serine/threonine protein kinase [Candidatus Rickettsiella viridis]